MNLTQPSQICKVYFDRSAGEYIVRNGREIARFPQGPENKTKALWAAIEHDAPAVASAARDLVALGADEARTIKAARLIIEGKVIQSRFDGDFAALRIEASAGNLSPVTGWAFYQISRNLRWKCDCCDYVYRADAFGPYACKHILAGKILQLLEQRRRDAAERKAADRPRSSLGSIKLSPAAVAAAEQSLAKSRTQNEIGRRVLEAALKADPQNVSRAGSGRKQFRARY